MTSSPFIKDNSHQTEWHTETTYDHLHLDVEDIIKQLKNNLSESKEKNDLISVTSTVEELLKFTHDIMLEAGTELNKKSFLVQEIEGIIQAMDTWGIY
jgi:hypothetical protein